jgi:hypothetical protein
MMSTRFPHACQCCGRRIRTNVAVTPPADLSERSRNTWHWIISTRRLDPMAQAHVLAQLSAVDVADAKIAAALRTPHAYDAAARAEAEAAWRIAAVASLRLWSGMAILRVPRELAEWAK